MTCTAHFSKLRKPRVMSSQRRQREFQIVVIGSHSRVSAEPESFDALPWEFQARTAQPLRARLMVVAAITAAAAFTRSMAINGNTPAAMAACALM